jgi:tetratricopeptide (TPR) repeat protein
VVGIGQFIGEIRRRRVLSTAALYIIAAWVAIQVADLAIDAGIIRWSLRNVFVAAFLGFPVALVVGWFYDVTRHGIARTPPVGADDPFDKSLNKRDYLLFVSLAVIWAVATLYVQTPTPVDKSIAILPFENRGHDPQGAALAFGVVLDLQTQLEKLQDIKVIAQSSVEGIDKDLSVPAIAQKIGVAFIMKGTVERVLDRVRVSVTLIDVEGDEQAYSGSWDRELGLVSLFDIRDDLASAITGNLQAVLSPQDVERIQSRPTEDFAAYQAYLLGKQRMAGRTVDSLAEAVEYFQQAVELDPEFALAYAGLADSYYLHDLYRGMPLDAAMPKMEAAISKALDLDPSLGEAYVSLANLKQLKDDYVGSEAAFKHALELSPNYATAHQWYGAVLENLGREEEALVQRREALELDPLSPIVNLVIGNQLMAMSRFEEALAHFRTAIEIDPDFAGAYERISEIYRFVFGQFDQAVIWQRKGIALDPDEPLGSVLLGIIYLDLGDPGEAERWFDRATELAPPGSMFSSAAKEPLYIFLGEEARALDEARKTIEMEPAAAYTLANLRNHDLRAGRYLEARERYERGYPELLNEDEPTVNDSNLLPAIDLALVLIRTGEQERANMILDRALEILPTLPRLGTNGFGFADVLIYSLQGQPREALSALRQAIDSGWRTAWWFYLEHDPSLDSVRDEPEFQAMLEEIRADMAAQLERVRTMEASGELEPVPDID